MEVKIVVGANYGDEGKGMATAYFSKQAYENKQKCLNILYNGSCQRDKNDNDDNRKDNRPSRKQSACSV